MMDSSPRGERTLITLENKALSLAVDAHTGTVIKLVNNISGLSLIQAPTSDVAWRLKVTEQPAWIEETTKFDSELAGQTLTLRWSTSHQLTVIARIELPDNADAVQFFVRVENQGKLSADQIEYPILMGIDALATDHDNYLLHSQGTGFLFKNPHQLFEDSDTKRGMRYSPYPEGFNGSATQLMAYYAENVGGFYFATHDPVPNMKWLNFYKAVGGSLECSFIHQCPDIQSGCGFEVGYAVTIAALAEGNWYAAAERYKRWAVQQKWTSGGALWQHSQKKHWLLEEVGFATFGVNAAADRSTWLDFFHHITDQPVFHIIGVNWSRHGGDYRGSLPGGHDDWFPAQFNAANLAVMRKNRDRWAPFHFNILLSTDKSESDAIKQALLVLPDEKLSTDKYIFPFICPTTDYLRSLHRWRDEKLITDYQPDGVYYDISANNVLMTCRNPEHGHPVGGGGWMMDAYASMFAETKDAMNAAKGSYALQGTEMISEYFIPYVDFYQARAEATPLAPFEGERYYDWITQNNAEKVPLFTYLYHEYGPVRLDGWGKLSPEVGDLFYWVAARVALQGGLFELNYEFSALEVLEDKIADNPDEHYYAFTRREYLVDSNKVAFVKEVATARTGFAKDFLVYGTMQRPLSFDNPPVELDFFQYNTGVDFATYERRGTMHVPTVMHTAWRYRDEKLGFLFCNLNRDVETSIQLIIDPTHYGFAADVSYRIATTTSEASQQLAVTQGISNIDIALPAHKIMLVQLSFSTQ